MPSFVQAKATDGKYYDVAVPDGFMIKEVAAPATQPVEPPPPPPPPPPAPTATIPLTRNDPRFAGNASAGATSVPNGGTLANKNILVSGAPGLSASVVLNSGGTLKNCAVFSEEAVRIGGAGTFLIDGCHLEALDNDPEGHADVVQVYTPGSTVNVTVRNSTIAAHNQNATAGFFVADYATGSFTFENVVFQSGPFGLRIHQDGKPISASLKDVFFVGPFGSKPFFFNEWAGPIVITKWENVRLATIVNGALVPGNLIPNPKA